MITTTAPKAGDKFRLLCQDGQGATILATVAAVRVTPISDGPAKSGWGKRFRITAHRPGTDDLSWDHVMEWTVDQNGRDVHDYCEPVR